MSVEAIPDALTGVKIELTALVGSARLSLREILDLQPDMIIEFSERIDDPIGLLANGREVATGELVAVNDRLAFRVISTLSRQAP